MNGNGSKWSVSLRYFTWLVGDYPFWRIENVEPSSTSDQIFDSSLRCSFSLDATFTTKADFGWFKAGVLTVRWGWIKTYIIMIRGVNIHQPAILGYHLGTRDNQMENPLGMGVCMGASAINGGIVGFDQPPGDTPVSMGRWYIYMQHTHTHTHTHSCVYIYVCTKFNIEILNIFHLNTWYIIFYIYICI